MKTVASKTANGVNIIVPAVKTEPDANLQFQNPNVVTTTSTVATAVSAAGVGNKRPVSLDLNKNNTPAKKQRLAVGTTITLDSATELPSSNLPPNTPDLEKILLSGNMLQTPQPGTVFPSKMVQVTSEQEAFGKGFEEALHSLHNSKNPQVNNAQLNNSSGSVTSNSSSSTNAGTGFSGGSFTYTNLDSTYPVAVKDEPNASASPPVSPIDMETQEKIKLERKRQRNRVAASKCRKRKLERISKLEDRVKLLKGENSELGQMVKSLKDHVAQLKQQVIDHCSAGCKIYTDSPMQGK